MAQNNELNPHLTHLGIGSPAATATIGGLFIPRNMTLIQAWLTDGATLAAGDTNYYSVDLQKNGVSVGIWSSKLTSPPAGSQGPMLANVPKSLALTTPVQLVAGDVLTAVVTKNGTGVPVTSTISMQMYAN